MPKFAIYYVPEAAGDFYKLGSEILAYDVRSEKRVKMSSKLRSRFSEFKPSWASKSRPYGFHLTISDSIDFNLGDLQQIEAELVSILQCFAARDKFMLHKSNSDFIPDWGLPIVLRYDPNDNLKLLHALVISRINCLGIGSGYLKDYLDDSEQYSKEPHNAKRILRFYSPFVLSDFFPHFSLLNPYTGSNRRQLQRELQNIFGRFVEFEVKSISLLIQLNEGANWTIYREYQVP